MNLRNFPGVNQQIKNIYRADLPYFWLSKNESAQNKNWVVFFGGALKDMDSSADRREYVRKTNLCLDFVRNKYKGLELYYKPHPSDLDEQKLLDLRFFEIINEKSNAEIFLLKNVSRIKYAFAVNSWAAASAYSFGANSYLFLPLFKSIFGEKLFRAMLDCFPGMPESFFISDLLLLPPENRVNLQEDRTLEINFRRILGEKSGKIWFIITTTDYAAIIISLARMVKLIDPMRPVGLIIYRHHRWDRINPDDLKSYFNEIQIFPRLFYSLKPSRLFRAIKLAKIIKGFKVSSDDIIIGTSHFEFAENCFVSYHKSAKKITVLTEKEFHLFYEMDHYQDVYFRQNKASLFYNKIFEPILGLHRTMFLSQEGGDFFNLTRYQRPLNEIYDEVYILGVPRN